MNEHTIDAKRMHVDGHEFYVTGNDVWLADQVPPKYSALLQLRSPTTAKLNDFSCPN